MRDYFFLILFLNIIKIIYSERTLAFVYEHVRHGARSPSSGYDSYFINGTDEYGVNWKYDGELSAIGKRQHYLLGVRNRLKYGKEGLGLIDFTKFDPREILIHATEYNRTHQSINSELYGMYLNYKEETLNQEEKSYYLVNTDYMKNSDPELLKEIDSHLETIDNKVNNGSIPVFNIKPFPPNRIFLVDRCTKLDQYRDEKVGKKVRELYDEFERRFAKNFTKFFKHPEYFRDYNKMKSITDHFICDYDNKKDLTNVTKSGINLTEFLDFSKRFYGNFIFNWFIDEYTSVLEETHLMQDLIGYMEKSQNNKDNSKHNYDDFYDENYIESNMDSYSKKGRSLSGYNSSNIRLSAMSTGRKFSSIDGDEKSDDNRNSTTNGNASGKESEFTMINSILL